MLVGGDICKALLKQEIRFSVLVPWTSLRFVVGFVLFFRGSMEIYEVFLWGLGSIYGKGDWDAKPTCSTAWAPSYGDAGWSSEHKEDARRGEEQGCMGQALQRDVAAPRSLSHPAHPCPSSWVLALVQAAPCPGSVAQQRRAVGLVLAT